MAKGRVANIMCEACRSDNSTKVRRVYLGCQPMAIHNGPPHHQPQRTPDARGFQTVRQTRPDIITLRQRKHLRLVLHATERRCKHNPVVILLEAAPVLRVPNLGIAVLSTQAIRRQ